MLIPLQLKDRASSACIIACVGFDTGEGGRIRLMAGKTDRSKCQKIFLQYWRAADRLSARR